MLPFPAEVVFTDASWDRNKTASADASAVSNRFGYLLEVIHTAVRNATAQDNNATAYEGAVHAGRTVSKSGSSTALVQFSQC